MDRIDANLFDAWNRLGALCQRDRIEALRRFRRRFNRTLHAPPRAACLCLRAADRRINPASAAISFDAGTTFPHYVRSTDEAVAHGLPHIVHLTGDLVRFLTKPVTIDWPGEDWKIVAAKCGVTVDTIRRWIKAGMVHVQRRDVAFTLGQRGPSVPIVFTPSPIDPNHVGAHPPHRIWGTIWQYQNKQLPEEFSQEVARVPRFANTCRGHRTGWDWVCPGRVDENGKVMHCGRRCRRLYGPLPVWTLAESSGLRWELEMPEDSGLAGTWHRGMEELGPRKGTRTFACKQCWGVRSVSMVGTHGWAAFAAYLSGGLLYGHEVERPLVEAPHARRIKPYVQRNPAKRSSPRRDLVMKAILRGESRRAIAAQLNMSPLTVKDHVRKIYRAHDVRCRSELIAKVATEARGGRSAIGAAG